MDMETRSGKMASPLRESPGMRGAAKLSHTKSLPPSQHPPMVSSRIIAHSTAASEDDDEPIYDHVASDDDYYNIPEDPPSLGRPHSSSGPSTTTTGGAGGSITSSPSKSNSSTSGKGTVTAALAGAASAATAIRPNEYNALKAQLESSEEKVQRLIESNDDMRTEIARLSVTVNKLVSENEQASAIDFKAFFCLAKFHGY